MTRRPIIIAAALLALALPATAAAPIAGTVSAVHDGDTFTIEGVGRIRMFGLDAPELRQLCATAEGACVPCGQAAREDLAAAILGKEVTCTARGVSYDRTVGECSVDGVAIGPRQLERGQGLAYKSYLRKADRPAYLGAEQRAKDAKAGIWGLTLVAPDAWRNRKQRLTCEK